MKQAPVESTVPTNSRAATLLGGASFFDCWSVLSPHTDSSALELFIAAAANSPRWVNLAMSARNRRVRLAGLKNLGTLNGLDSSRRAQSYRPGDRVGIFTLFEQSFDEVLVGDKDKHLNVVLSVHRALTNDGKSVLVSLTTVVHVKNLLGRLYMLPVRPAHRVIAPAVLGRIATVPNAA
jgi:hypothetical protein